MHRLMYAGLPLPEIYVTNVAEEARQCAEYGMPYVFTNRSDEEIIKIILFRVLRKRFSKIRWEEVLGVNGYESVIVRVPGSSVGTAIAKGARSEGPIEHCMAESERTFDAEGAAANESIVPIESFCADAAASVNIEQLQSLGFLPKFMDDAVDAVRINLENRMRWQDGYNKRLGCCVGDVTYATSAANLIILDVSGSIPDGISSTMIELIATLREQADAELIITGSCSLYFGRDEQLPDPDWIRSNVGYANEGAQFFRILRDRIAGRHFGNVISFGDNDTPNHSNSAVFQELERDARGTRVDRVLHYHTTYSCRTGYAKWCKMLSPECEEVFDTNWCRVMSR